MSWVAPAMLRRTKPERNRLRANLPFQIVDYLVRLFVVLDFGRDFLAGVQNRRVVFSAEGLPDFAQGVARN